VGHGGRAHALKASVFAKREFAGFWEYLLDTRLFTTPPHPEWSGAALLDDRGRSSASVRCSCRRKSGDDVIDGNMFVPVDLIEPILGDLVRTGRSADPPRPWLGMYTADRKAGWSSMGSQPAARRARGRACRRSGRRRRRASACRAWPSSFAAYGEWDRPAPKSRSRWHAAAARYVRVSSGDRNDYLRKPSLQ
jgi:hypothetical protein